MNEIITTTNPEGIIDLTGVTPEIITTTLPKMRNMIKVAVPSLADIMLAKPDKPTYRDGKRQEITHYGNTITTNSFGTKELKDYKGGVEDLIKDIKADFHVKPHRLQYINPINGNTMEMPNYYLFNESNGNILNSVPVSERYTVLDFDECIRYFYAIIEEIRKRGYECTPDVARVYDNGNKMFLQYSISGNKIMGEEYKTNICLLTSHNKTFSYCICISAIRCFCANQINRMLKGCDSMLKIRHTKVAKNAIEAESFRVLSAADNQHKLLGDYLQNLASIKINDQMIYDAWMKINNIDTTELIPAASATKLTSRLGEYFACYDMEDCLPYKNTALGAYFAMTDFSDHVIPARTTENFSDSKIEDAIYNGNPAVSNFIDSLVTIAS